MDTDIDMETLPKRRLGFFDRLKVVMVTADLKFLNILTWFDRKFKCVSKKEIQTKLSTKLGAKRSATPLGSANGVDAFPGALPPG
ncbi:MAG: hypothetical protein JJU29_12100 [Verrucomicrobia bacterium]|nr:hypothetical protein [Verrucomicrobiota bacterium]MCH8511695.1 hypothetical protein [Kiritimatiellia bacterium]